MAVVLILISVVGGVYISDVNALNELQVSVHSVDLPDIKLTYCVLYFVVNVSNPSIRDVSGVSAEFTVNVSGVVVGTGNVPEIAVLAESYKHQTVSVRVYYSDVASAVIETIKGGGFDVEINGLMYGKVLFGFVTVSEKINSSYSGA